MGMRSDCTPFAEPILALMRDGHTRTCHEIARAIRKPSDQTCSILSRLVSRGMIVKHDERRPVRYVIAGQACLLERCWKGAVAA